MSITTIRDTIAAYSPPWLRAEVGGTILRAFGVVLDALTAREVEGVKLRFPSVGSPTALGAMGNDRQIERGPSQTDPGYIVQLLSAHATWKYAGSARTLLKQLRAYFAPSDGPPMRTVFVHFDEVLGAKAVWHFITPSTGTVTKTKAANWFWKSEWLYLVPVPWWWGWVIIDGSSLWTADYWDEEGTWGDGGVWGSSMTYDETRSLIAIIRKWCPAHMCVQPVVVFADIFNTTSAQPPNPDGQGEDDSWRAGVPAIFLETIRQ